VTFAVVYSIAWSQPDRLALMSDDERRVVMPRVW
jgi:hypothetical protein